MNIGAQSVLFVELYNQETPLIFGADICRRWLRYHARQNVHDEFMIEVIPLAMEMGRKDHQIHLLDLARSSKRLQSRSADGCATAEAD